ncbi:NnrU family protein [Salipiger mucosus]|uniref:NnrU family protein, required for expression of nitric oxide and nitrite reductase (Nir and Nor) n=1 Tax=Salipiger mucosus DSM 16094 TaxID=1123237 RepID=S9Q7Q0_9RHOB|nr:NnrU family protein [Salipiger mucosus]EPX75603.1 NnrU family protein, required for expression of nitric oxide and nitrite reductase (Nir and Nor) [Salipiger mucosus DSM 16094]
MTGWTEYALALVLFVASHFLPRLGGLRERLIGSVGRRIYFSVYGLVSIALLVWVISAAIRAPHVQLWPQLPWTRWVPNIAMPVAIILVTCGIGMRQPFTLGGRRGAEFDPAQPGFAAVSRHPLFLALALWSGAHLVPNGELSMVILFGSFLAMALAAMPAFDARARRALDDSAEPFLANTAILSPAPLMRRDWLRANARGTAIRAAIGLFLWVGLLHLHTMVIGASPFPI